MKRIKKGILPLLFFAVCATYAFSQDWKNIPVPADPGKGNIWKLNQAFSDDFNYEGKTEAFYSKWLDGHFNKWMDERSKKDHTTVMGGSLLIKASNGEGSRPNVGMFSSKKPLLYPIYVEASIKPNKLELASNFWLLSADDTREIDAMIVYGGTKDPYYANNIVSNYHVFIRDIYNNVISDYGFQYMYPLQEKGSWADKFHTFGIYWKSPTEVSFYIDGKKIEESTWQNAPLYDANNTRQYLNKNENNMDKELFLILNTQVHDWRTANGHISEEDDLDDANKNTMYVDWVRAYTPVPGYNNTVTKDVIIKPSSYQLKVKETLNLSKTVSFNKTKKIYTNWSSNNANVAMIDSNGQLLGISPGEALITLDVNNGKEKAHYYVSINENKPEEIIIEAENFCKTGGTYNDGTVPYGVNATPYKLNMINLGDWVEYVFAVEKPGDYQINYQISSPLDNAKIKFELDGVTISEDDVPNNGFWDKYQQLTASKIIKNLKAGEHKVKIIASGTNEWQWNFERFSLKLVSDINAHEVLPTGINISKNYLVLKRGTTYELRANVIPSNASQKKVKWTTANPGVVKLVNDGLISAVNEGSTIINVSTEDGEYYTSCIVVVSSDE